MKSQTNTIKKIDPKNVVKKFIANLKIMYYNQDPLLESIDNFQNLYSALCDLDEIVGMYDIKKSIVDQIKFLLVNYTGSKNKFEGHLLHTMICGPPGTGKTTVGICLSNIWNALGLLKKNSNILKTQNKQKKSIIKISPSKDTESVEKNKFDDIFLMALIGLMSERTKEKEKENNEETNEKTMLSRKEKNENISKRQLITYVDDKNTNENNNEYKNEEFDLIHKQYSESNDDVGDFMRHRSYTIAGINNIKKSISTKKIDSFKKLQRIKFDESSIKIVSRPDFVGLYVGHSADRTRTLLTDTLNDGKVLFIDEAYSLINDEKDSFGNESLNEINRFMSENPNLIIIFAGYKDRIENSIFKAQSGLKRRIAWTFEITKYTGEMLSTIFLQQLEKENWCYEGDIKQLTKFFDDNLDHFEAFGGDTSRMVFYCKLRYSELKFDFDLHLQLKTKTITNDIFMSAYEDMYSTNKPKPHINMSYLSMYC